MPHDEPDSPAVDENPETPAAPDPTPETPKTGHDCNFDEAAQKLLVAVKARVMAKVKDTATPIDDWVANAVFSYLTGERLCELLSLSTERLVELVGTNEVIDDHHMEQALAHAADRMQWAKTPH